MFCIRNRTESILQRSEFRTSSGLSLIAKSLVGFQSGNPTESSYSASPASQPLRIDICRENSNFSYIYRRNCECSAPKGTGEHSLPSKDTENLRNSLRAISAVPFQIRNGEVTWFGTRGSEVQILFPRPVFSQSLGCH